MAFYKAESPTRLKGISTQAGAQTNPDSKNEVTLEKELGDRTPGAAGYTQLSKISEKPLQYTELAKLYQTLNKARIVRHQ